MFRRGCIFMLAVFCVALPVLCQSDLRALYMEAQQAQAAGDLPAATRKYEAIIKLKPDMAEAYANIGNLYYQQGMALQAKAAYHKALALKPQLAAPRFFLGVLAFNEHNYVAALTEFKAALNAPAPAPNPLLYAYLGYTHFAMGNFAAAAENLEHARQANPSDSDVLYHLSKSYGHLADQSFAGLQKADPDSLYVLLARGHLAENNEDWKEAAREYALARQKLPDAPRLIWRAQNAALLADGKTPESAASPFDEVVDGSLQYKDATASAGKINEEISGLQARVQQLAPSGGSKSLYLRGEAYQALAYLTSLDVMESDPDSFRAHQLRAQMFEGANNDEEAIKEYREALQRKPDLQNTHFAIGTLYWKDHHPEDAARELEAELKINPHHPQALYELGDIAASDGRNAEAEKYFIQAVKLQPGMAEPHFALEKIYSAEGHFAQSLEELKAALKSNPSDATAHYRLAVVYRKLGRVKEAEHELALFDQAKAYSGSSNVK